MPQRAPQPSAIRGTARRQPDRADRLPGGITMVFCHIPAGPFLMGSTQRELERIYGRGRVHDGAVNERPQHMVTLPEYWMAKYPVTVEQYAAFVRATGYVTSAEKQRDDWTWTTPRGRGSDILQRADHPVTCVTWRDVMAFCLWVSWSTQKDYRLPTEAEWEKAARGPRGRIYPWGNRPPNETRCNYGDHVGETTPVGRYRPASPYGCADLVGNVWEWTSSLYRDYPYNAGDGREDPDEGGPRVVRGGALDVDEDVVRGAARYGNLPSYHNRVRGFRLVAAPAPDVGISGF